MSTRDGVHLVGLPVEELQVPQLVQPGVLLLPAAVDGPLLLRETLRELTDRLCVAAALLQEFVTQFCQLREPGVRERAELVR